MAISFRATLLLIFTSLLSVVLGITTWAVLRATDANAKANTVRELEVAERVFNSLMQENRRQLTDRAVLLAEDFGFKRAIATDEEDTIVSVLGNHGDRIGADMILLMDPEGEVTISSHDIGGESLSLLQNIQSHTQPFNLLVIAEHTPFQLVFVPVRAPGLIAWVGMGFAIDRNLMDRFRTITKSEVTLLYQQSADSALQSISTIDGLPNISSATSQFVGATTDYLEQLVDRGWLSHKTELLTGDRQQLSLVLSVSLAEALATYKELQQQMLIIAALALCLAIAVVVVVARSITEPVVLLVAAARRIAQGDYRQAIKVDNKNEFGVLGDTLNLMQQAIEEREQQISFQAQHDLLTGLPNQGQFESRFKSRAQSAVDGFSVALLKLANLPQLSDVYGVSVIEKLLPLVARRLSMATHKNDFISCIGRGEFILLLNSQRDACNEVAEHYAQVFEMAFDCETILVKADVSMGFLLCPEHADNFEDMMRRIYMAQSQARTGARLYSVYEVGSEASHLRKINVTNRLQFAIASGSFELMYQPQLDLATNRVTSVEALIRWEDDELGKMYPDEFIPLAEHTGDITKITDWVLAEATKQLKQWVEEGFDVGVSINLSARDILKDEFIDRLLASIENGAIDRNRIMLEITESAMIVDQERTLRNLQRLYDFGIDLAMDDFGTGYSSLAQLKSMPIHELKIDKSFVLSLAEDEVDQRIVRSTIDMAHQLGLTVIAEGVEDLASLNVLRDMGCNSIQGYYLARPMPLVQMKQWLKNFKAEILEPENE